MMIEENELIELEEKNEELEKQYLIFEIGNEKFAFSIKNIKEIITKPRINKSPNLPDFYLGMTKLRNDILPIISLRKRLSYNLLEEENKNLVELLKLREEDHVRWLDELEMSVNENRDFRLARDPHQCKFGQWYYSYKAESYSLATQLKKFEEPHKILHSIADIVIDEFHANGKEAAKKMINSAKQNELKRMLEIFHELYDTLLEDQRETAIVFMDENDKQYGFVVDKIDRIISIPPEQIDLPSSDSEFERYLKGIGKVGDDFYLIFNEVLLK